VRKLEDARKIPAILAEAGIRLVLVEPLPGSKLDGACFWLSEEEPVIALSLRYDRHDIFCHAMFHELDHVKHREGRTKPILDIDLLSPDEANADMEMEKRANKHAAEILIPERELKSLLKLTAGHYAESRILAFASQMKVHPGIVVGRLQYLGHIPHSAFNALRAKIKPIIVDFALADGFGKLVQ
jgi:HTH-type transcriptional regulator/antitoxin HigA